MRARSTVFSSLSWTSTGGNPIWWKNGRQSSTTGLVIVWRRFGSLHREDFACYLFLDSTISTSKIHFLKLTANAFWNWPNLPQVEPTLFQPSRCQLAVSFRECFKEKKGNSNPVLPTQLWSLSFLHPSLFRRQRSSQLQGQLLGASHPTKVNPLCRMSNAWLFGDSDTKNMWQFATRIGPPQTFPTPYKWERLKNLWSYTRWYLLKCKMYNTSRTTIQSLKIQASI